MAVGVSPNGPHDSAQLNRARNYVNRGAGDGERDTYRVPEQLVSLDGGLADPDAVVPAYDVLAGMARQVTWSSESGDESWAAFPDMMAETFFSYPGAGVDCYLPSEHDAVLAAYMDDNDAAEGAAAALDSVSETVETPCIGGSDGYDREAFVEAVAEIGEQPVIASYDRWFAEETDITAATPETITAALDDWDWAQPYRHDRLNKIYTDMLPARQNNTRNVSDRYADEYGLEADEVDTVVLDHGCLYDIIFQQDNWMDQLALIDEVKTYQEAGHDITVHLPHDHQKKLYGFTNGSQSAETLGKDLEMVMDQAVDISGPVRLEHHLHDDLKNMTEDARIVEESTYLADTAPLIVANDADFLTIQQYSPLDFTVLPVRKARASLHQQYGHDG